MSVRDAVFVFWLVIFGGIAFMSAAAILGAARGRNREAAYFWGTSFFGSALAAAYFLWRLL